MLTLDELGTYYEKGLVRLRIDFYPDPGSPKRKKLGERWGVPGGLANSQVRQIFTEKKLSIVLKRQIILFDKKFTMETEREEIVFDVTKEGHLAVSIERGDVERSQWGKIKKQMREAGFSYRSESPWFCVYKKGKWVGWPFC